MNTFSIISLAAIATLSCSCTIPEPTMRYSYEPNPMTDEEYESKVDRRARELMKEGKLSKSEAKRQAERETDRDRWESEFIPVHQCTWEWKFE